MGADATPTGDEGCTDSGTTVSFVGTSEVTNCYRHEDRRSGVLCQRCDRPICGACMTQASVGFHCPECTISGRQQVHRGPIAVEPVATKALLVVNVAISLAVIISGGGALRLPSCSTSVSPVRPRCQR